MSTHQTAANKTLVRLQKAETPKFSESAAPPKLATAKICFGTGQTYMPYLTLPEYVQEPKAGRTCPYTDLSRAVLRALCVPSEENGHKPPVKSHMEKLPGATRAVRLISLQSLRDYLGRAQSEIDAIPIPSRR
jgi:hypothetical protein